MAKSPDRAWMTDDLLRDVTSNAALVRQMADPRIQDALALMGKDPKAALAKYRNDRAVTDFIVAFSKIMAGHYAKMATTTTGAQ
ncbi:STI1/HOP DP domain-containing protein [Plasmodiophora brassicae]|nr:hypothetical protein PBRA_008719 [Plasmodiophora brassicae]